VEGVLTEMPPAQFDAGQPLLRLLSLLQNYVDRYKLGGSFAIETDVIVSQRKVAVADAVYLTNEQLRRQETIYAKSQHVAADSIWPSSRCTRAHH